MQVWFLVFISCRSELRRFSRLTSLLTAFGKFKAGLASETKIIYILTNFGPNDEIRKPICSSWWDPTIYEIKNHFSQVIVNILVRACERIYPWANGSVQWFWWLRYLQASFVQNKIMNIFRMTAFHHARKPTYSSQQDLSVYGIKISFYQLMVNILARVREIIRPQASRSV